MIFKEITAENHKEHTCLNTSLNEMRSFLMGYEMIRIKVAVFKVADI
jgi:hypothetical protein